MPVLDDLLLRFRRVWAPPGPVVGQAGVPTDLLSGIDDEIRELTATLAAIDEEAQSIVRSAEAQASRTTGAARTEAEGILREAAARVPEVRATGAASRILTQKVVIDGLIAQAEREAALLRGRSGSRLEGALDSILAAVFASTDGSLEENDAHLVGRG